MVMMRDPIPFVLVLCVECRVKNCNKIKIIPEKQILHMIQQFEVLRSVGYNTKYPSLHLQMPLKPHHNVIPLNDFEIFKQLYFINYFIGCSQKRHFINYLWARNLEKYIDKLVFSIV